MAVYERNYKAYAGDVTSPKWRFLILPRYAYRDVMKSKLFIAFLVCCFIMPFLDMVWIYLPHNATFANLWSEITGDLLDLTVGSSFYFNFFMRPQGLLAFFLSLIVGPALVSADLRNNAMPLYLSRPFNRRDYILGKMSVLVLLISLITWVPGLLLFALQSYLSGFDWFMGNLRTAVAILAGSWILILILSLASLAISAYMKWKPIAQAAYFGIMLASMAASLLVNSLFRTQWGGLLNITDMFAIVWKSLFALNQTSTIPVPIAWLSLFAFCGLCLAVLLRKVRAYEVIK